MTDDYVLDDNQRAQCERELMRYREQWLTDEEKRIISIAGEGDELNAGIEIGFRAAWAYLDRLHGGDR